MKDVFKIAEELKASADSVLSDKSIVEKLEPHVVTFTGSYALNLMVWPDIDIQVEVDSKYDRVKIFTELAYRFLNDRDFKDVKLINFVPGKKPGMPTGMYMGLNCNYNNMNWKIDIWALDYKYFEENKKYMKNILLKLNQDKKRLILKWKHKLLVNDRIPKLGSYMLYKAILFENLTNDNEIKNYLIVNGVKFDLL